MLHNDRYSRYRFGLLGEYAACLLLWSKGYRIVARRVRNFAGEIDIIARRGKLLIFIEVKARNCAVLRAVTLSDDSAMICAVLIAAISAEVNPPNWVVVRFKTSSVDRPVI